MGWVLTVFLSKVVIVLLVLVAVAALTLIRIRRRLRVSPSVRTDAPLTWLAIPLPAARLHRRLQSAVNAVRAVRGTKRRLRRDAPTAVQRLADDVEREAVAVDERLVAVAKLGTTERRIALGSITSEVRNIERLAHRVVEMARVESATPQLQGTPTAVDDLIERADRIQQAQAELQVIDTTAGLGVPIPPPPPGPPPAPGPGVIEATGRADEAGLHPTTHQ